MAVYEEITELVWVVFGTWLFQLGVCPGAKVFGLGKK